MRTIKCNKTMLVSFQQILQFWMVLMSDIIMLIGTGEQQNVHGYRDHYHQITMIQLWKNRSAIVGKFPSNEQRWFTNRSMYHKQNTILYTVRINPVWLSEGNPNHPILSAVYVAGRCATSELCSTHSVVGWVRFEMFQCGHNI